MADAERRLQVGDVAPEFELPAHDGRSVRLADFHGRPVVVFFFSKAMTLDCTRLACAFRDRFADFQAAGAEVVGISPDPVRQQVRFVEKHNLPFALLADENREAAGAYGVWRLKEKLGQEYRGIVHTTFVIDADGRIAAVIETADLTAQAEEARRALGS
jgi:peroxiredoxin Q/BCP